MPGSPLPKHRALIHESTFRDTVSQAVSRCRGEARARLSMPRPVDLTAKELCETIRSEVGEEGSGQFVSS